MFVRFRTGSIDAIFARKRDSDMTIRHNESRMHVLHVVHVKSRLLDTVFNCSVGGDEEQGCFEDP